MSVTAGAGYPERTEDRMTIDGMTPAHAKPSRRDHLWVLVIIAGFAMYDVWGAWAQIGNKSGFAHGTGWTLTVIAEAYWGYALFAWFRAPGPRSRRFAMWSAAAVFIMSAVSQAASHLAADKMPPAAVVVFVSILPVTVLALIAVLIHLRQKDREESAEADERAGVQAETDTLRAELQAAREALAGAAAERETALREAAEAAAKIETLTRKLAAAATRKRTPQRPAKKPASAPRSNPAENPATEVPNDVDAQAEALSILAAEPDISGAKLAERVGKSERWGQTFKKNLAGSAAGPEGRPDE